MVRDENWIREMLKYSMFCTVATVLDGQPFLRPSAFIYVEEDHAIYIHGAHSGRTVDNVKKEPRVCLCVYAVGAFRLDDRAFSFFQENAGVIVFGTASPLSDNDKKRAVLQAMFEKHTPHLTVDVDYEPASREEIDKTSVTRIDIDRWSGKLRWTDEPERERYFYKDVIGDRRPRLPWTHDMSADPLTVEWQNSLGKDGA
jgi:hypothetical protein